MTKFSLNDPRRRFLFCHQLDVPWVTELFRQFCHPSAGNAYKINMFQFGFADMPRVFACCPAVLTGIGVFYVHRITQVTGISFGLSTAVTYMNIIFHNGFPFIK